MRPQKKQVKENLLKWYSPSLGLDTEMLIIGHAGYPIIIFPTTKGTYHENRDFKMMEMVRWMVEQGKIRFYCPSSVDKYSWYNKTVHPAERAKNHNYYDSFILREVVESITFHHGYHRVCVAGPSFGAFHALNFAFRHPDRVSHLIAMSGNYDISTFMDGYYNDDVYFNNPVDFMPGNNHHDLWRMNIVLGAGEHDICLEGTIRMSEILRRKHIKHWLDIRHKATHDWPLWRQMLPDYLRCFA